MTNINIKEVEKILEETFENNNATLRCCETVGDDLVVDYEYYVNSGGDMSGTIFVKIAEFKEAKQIIKKISNEFKRYYDNFDEDDFVREYMDMVDGPCIRELLDDAEELCDFYENMFMELCEKKNRRC